MSLKGSFRNQTSESNRILPSITVVILLVTSNENLDLGPMTYVKEDFFPVVSPAAFLDKICWILVGDRYHLWCIYTYCSKLFCPPRISLPFFICLVFPSISSFIKMCIFRKGAPVFLSPYVSVIQKVKSAETGAPVFLSPYIWVIQRVKSAEIFLYFDIKFQLEDTGNGKISLRYYFQKCIDISYLSPPRGDLTKKSLSWSKRSYVLYRP